MSVLTIWFLKLIPISLYIFYVYQKVRYSTLLFTIKVVFLYLVFALTCHFCNSYENSSCLNPREDTVKECTEYEIKRSLEATLNIIREDFTTIENFRFFLLIKAEKYNYTCETRYYWNSNLIVRKCGICQEFTIMAAQLLENLNTFSVEICQVDKCNNKMKPNSLGPLKCISPPIEVENDEIIDILLKSKGRYFFKYFPKILLLTLLIITIIY